MAKANANHVARGIEDTKPQRRIGGGYRTTDQSKQGTKIKWNEQ